MPENASKSEKNGKRQIFEFLTQKSPKEEKVWKTCGKQSTTP
jgi:hypothetical protein